MSASMVATCDVAASTRGPEQAAKRPYGRYRMNMTLRRIKVLRSAPGPLANHQAKQPQAKRSDE